MNLTKTAAVGVLFVVGGLSGCTGSDSSAVRPADQSRENAFSAAGMVGPGCAGAGSVLTMAGEPLPAAVARNPKLTQLSAALSGKLNSKVSLANTLNGRDFTVFAPVDAAFQKLPASELQTLKTDQQALTGLLTYHIVTGQIAPGDLPGKQMTVANQPVTVTGTGNDLRINGAKVLCGGVKTANATVYLIDTVLTPPKG